MKHIMENPRTWNYYPMPTNEMTLALGGWSSPGVFILDGHLVPQQEFAKLVAKSVADAHHLVGQFTPITAVKAIEALSDAFVVIDHIEFVEARDMTRAGDPAQIIDDAAGFEELFRVTKERKLSLLLCLTCRTGIPNSRPDDSARMRIVIDRVYRDHDQAMGYDLKADVQSARGEPGRVRTGEFKVPIPPGADGWSSR